MCKDHDRQPTFLRKSVHQAVVNVDEEGTEAATIIIGIIQCAGKTPSNEFVSDHPFTFFMMEERAIVFAGHVLDPTKWFASRF